MKNLVKVVSATRKPMSVFCCAALAIAAGAAVAESNVPADAPSAAEPTVIETRIIMAASSDKPGASQRIEFGVMRKGPDGTFQFVEGGNGFVPNTHTDGTNPGMGPSKLAPQMRSPVVKGAPYSADVVAEKLKTLRDGNQIADVHKSRVHRDSMGRTRQETINTSGAVEVVYVRDPNEDFSLTLSPARKTAIQISQKILRTPEVARLNADFTAASNKRYEPEIQRAVDEALARALSNGASKSGTVTVTRTTTDGAVTETFQGQTGEISTSNSAGPVRKIFVVDGKAKRVAEFGEFGQPEGDVKSMFREVGAPLRLANVVKEIMAEQKFAKQAVKTSLGFREFSGVRAEGTLSSYSIPANAVGNLQPLVVTEEVWRSVELQVVVYSKHSDPREGDVIYRLENIQRAEQPTSLFTIPADYKLTGPRPVPNSKVYSGEQYIAREPYTVK